MVRISPLIAGGRYVDLVLGTSVLLALLWHAVVTVLTLMPGKDIPRVDIVDFDKVAHLGAFGLMTWLYLRTRIARPWIIASGCATYGVLIEVAQGQFTVDRQADPYDALANAIGCFLAVLIFTRGFRVVSNGK